MPRLCPPLPRPTRPCGVLHEGPWRGGGAVCAAVAVALVLLPGPLTAQTPAQLMRALARGGGWIQIPVEDGAGELRTDTVPTMGLPVEGCVTVWPGHSGVWEIDVQEPLGGGALDATTLPGEGIPFTYRTGPRSRLEVDVRWSEPRDTTLLLWIGLGAPEASGRDPCEPVYDHR